MKFIRKLLILALILTSSCTSNNDVKLMKKIVFTPALKRASLGEGLNTGVRIIKTYPNEEICRGGNFSANLFVCYDIDHKDTLYVLNACDSVPSFTKVDSDEIFVIDHEDIKDYLPDKVIIKVPVTFSIPKNAKCIFSNLTRLED